ncbi:group-specific protein [Chengkuizengella axinellae]|uniref:Group-specific protein n=1 Tax=Chengkuizengella axinellae TaxID=3064388 RepID=A0ABT9IVW1_9BACL|nr:group-specific protein [Chengkuizengella sp. 2205SS18-9]MDP5273227.1 group-specific protein [Chengkuizengella sp. 2205SS18-9]
MVEVKLDEKEVRKIIIEKLEDKVKEIDAEHVFWDTAELRRRTCMCWNTIQNTFFDDPRFIKRKIGHKWYFPARETREFLVEWLEEQPK